MSSNGNERAAIGPLAMPVEVSLVPHPQGGAGIMIDWGMTIPPGSQCLVLDVDGAAKLSTTLAMAITELVASGEPLNPG